MKTHLFGAALFVCIAGSVLPAIGRAQDGGECASNAKSFFSNSGVLENDGGRARPVARPATPVKQRVPEQPQAQSCRVGGSAVAAAPAAPYSGLAFWAEKLKCESATPMRTTEFRFVTGDCARLFFKTNTAGYLYIANVGSDNRVDDLYPRRGQSNAREAGDVADVAVRFVGTPGVERVFVMFSKARIADAPSLALALALANQTSGPNAVRGVVLSDGRGNTGRSKSLELLEEQVTASRPDAARYVVVSDAELMQFPVMVMKLDLLHERP